jgi:hypothetical protein
MVPLDVAVGSLLWILLNTHKRHKYHNRNHVNNSNQCRDLDLCRDPDLSSEETWRCGVCEQPYEMALIENSLVEIVQRRSVAYQVQVKYDNRMMNDE